MPSRKVVPVKYTSRDFQSIKDDLVNYAKRYYSDTFKDFNEASFGSLMLDTVSYVGDVLSFYLDYQANESFLDTAIEYENVVKLGRQFGYKFRGAPTSYGTVAVYITVPAASTGLGPDSDYIPILRRGSTFSSVDGVGYILNENIDFSDASNEVVVADVNSTTGVPTSYAIRAYGQVISGDISTEEITIGDFTRFLKVTVPAANIAEILSVEDAEGHRYYEVENLSQNTLFVEVANQGADSATVGALIKPIVVPRRFVVINDADTTQLQFGYGSEENLTTNLIPDPSNVVLNIHGKNYVTDTSFDPSKLTKTDKFGVAPNNTTLTVTFRNNSTERTNAAVGAIVNVRKRNFVFPKEEEGTTLLASKQTTVITSLEVTNQEPIIGDVALPTSEEIKTRIYGNYSAQNRAVTLQDYEAMVYNMPPQFGSIKRVTVIQDKNSFKRNLNMYVIAEDNEGKLVAANSTLKNNLKSWITKYKMLNDTVDILDAYILNIGISFTAVSNRNANKFDVLAAANDYLREYMLSRTYDIGERFYISDVYGVLRAVPGLLDVVDVTVTQRTGALYSSIPFNISDRIDPDGRYIDIPKNVIVEVKYPDNDIKGIIR